MERSRKPPSFLGNLTLLLGSAAICLLLLEAGMRLYYGIGLLETKNFSSEQVLTSWDYHSPSYDSLTGWKLPHPSNNPLHYPENGPNALPQEPGKTILAVGDSMVAGGLDPSVTWAAQLESILGIPVLNAGIVGFGIDQTYLRTGRFVEAFKPGTVIFSFVPDNIRRAELSVFYAAPKPYFDVVDGELVLRNVPPPRYQTSVEHIGWIRKILGHSYAVHRAILALGFQEKWLVGDYEQRYEHHKGAEVGCLLMKELEKMQEEEGFDLIIFPQYASHDMDGPSGPFAETYKKFQMVVACAKNTGLLVADPLEMLTEKLGNTEERREAALRTYWRYPEDPHMSPAGDRLMAGFLAPIVTRNR